MRRTCLTLLLMLAPAVALADVDAILKAGAEACAEQDNGTFGSEGAVKEIDLNGDGTMDTVVDESLFSCSTAASLYGGTGGSTIHFLVDGTETTRLALAWDTANWSGVSMVLVALHGTECGATGIVPCFEAMVWHSGAFNSIRPPQP